MDIDVDDIIKYIDAQIGELESKEYKGSDSTVLTCEIQNQLDNFKNDIDLVYKQSLGELNNLIGLKEVKEEIKKLVNYLIFIKKLGNKIKLDSINLNMVFRGNPGTGKTTVARIVATILCKLGFLKNDTVLETTPRDFIAGYVGQTAIKAQKTIEKAKGGIIFIDEAYTFSQSADESGHTFTYEAITEIIKEMEKKETIFIFAGYSQEMDDFILSEFTCGLQEMDDFIELNPGIKSRVAYDINFMNYTKEELFTIFDNKVKNAGLILSCDAKEILLDKIESKMKNKNFGNGRMIDNLFDEILREHASNNLYETDDNKLLLIMGDTIKNIKIKTEGGMFFG